MKPIKLTREVLCDRIRRAKGTRTHAEIADMVTEQTDRKRVYQSHISEALNPAPKDPHKYDSLRCDLAGMLLGGEYEIERHFIRARK